MATALLLAAGSGQRLGAERPKAFVVLAGKPMLQWSVEALLAAPSIEQVVVALPPGEEAPAGTTGVPGGETRSHSVKAALAASVGDPVLVHDAARPLLNSELVEAVLVGLGSNDAVVAATPVADTIKRTDCDLNVVETLERDALWAVQTPQVFHREALERVLSAPDELLVQATDDAWLVERAEGSVVVVEASSENIKVTSTADLELAAQLLASR